MLRDLALNSHKGAIMFVRQVDELFGDLLLEIKLRVKPLKGIERSLKRFQSLRVLLRLRFFFLLFIEVFFYFFMSINIGCFNDVDLHSAESRKNGVQLVRVRYSIRQGLIKVVEREIALLLGELDEFAETELNLSRRVSFSF